MKKHLKTHIFSLLLGFVLLIFFSQCKKYVDVAKPVDQLTTTAIFSDSTSAESTVIGLYNRQAKTNFSTFSFLYGNVTIYPGLSSDELINTYSSADPNAFLANNILSTSTVNLNNWGDGYNIIYQANSIIANLPSSPLTTNLKSKLNAEAKFMRALNLFYLTNEYGAIPMPTTPNYTTNGTLSRTDTGAVYSQIIADLKDVQQSVGIAVTDPAPANRIRASKLAATALLARVYLYTKDYASAITQATTVISSGKFAINNQLDNTFLVNSNEILFQFVPPLNTLFDTAEGYSFVPDSPDDPPYEYMTTQLISAFESDDQRFVHWVGSMVSGGKTYYYPLKYKTWLLFSGNPTEDDVVLRLSEQYLIRAEAEAQQGNLALAIADLDVIRFRAGLPLIGATDPAITKADLLTKIYHEDQIEFFAEWGHRWFDLKRTGMVNTVMSAVKPTTWKPTASLYPIPYTETLSDPSLKQNPGY